MGAARERGHSENLRAFACLSPPLPSPPLLSPLLSRENKLGLLYCRAYMLYTTTQRARSVLEMGVQGCSFLSYVEATKMSL